MVTPLTCSPAEAAELIGLSEDHIRSLVHDGVLPRVPHTGRAIRIPRAQLLEVFRLTEPEAVMSGAPVRVIDGGSFS